MTITKQNLWQIAALLGGTAVLIVPQSAGALHVLAPAVVAVWICTYCITRVWRKDRHVPILDIGVLCVIFSTLYTVIPLLNFYFGGLSFGLLSDARLQYHRPSAEELGSFFGNHVAYLMALTLAYLLFRCSSNGGVHRFHVVPPRPRTVGVMVVVFLALSLYFAALLHMFGVGFRSGYGEESYITEGPLWLQQINGKLKGIQFDFQAAVVAFLVLRKDDIRARWFLFLIIAWNIVTAFVQPGSRGELMSLLLLTFLFWHGFHGTTVRFTTLVLLLASFIAFMFLGVYRSFGSMADLALAIDTFETIASAQNEFQSSLGTAFDVSKMIEGGASIPSILALNDFTPMLPPQQFLPFNKVTAAEWYLVQIGQDGTGVGFMWSVISQSLIGLGLIELVARGAVLGWFLAWIHRWYQRRSGKFLPTVVYVILCLTSLWTFRDTTGVILWIIFWELVPFAAVFYLFGLRAEFSVTSPNKPLPQQPPLMPAVVRP